MSRGWTTIAGLSAISYALKAAGPLLLGGRRLPARVETVVARLPGPLLAALVMTSTFTVGRHVHLDDRAVGLAAAAVALWRGAGFVTVVMAAAAATALVRLL